MWNIFYRNVRLLILTICLILAWGFSSLQMLPRMEDPALSQWYGKITTRLPGANAERVESVVTEKIEQKLQEIEEINLIESTSQLGTSLVVVKLQDRVKNHDEVWSRVRDSLNDITPQLPSEAIAPNLEDVDFGRAYTLIVALTWKLNSQPNYSILNRIAEELEQKLYGVGNVEEITFWGAPSEEIRVEIDPTNLAILGLTPQQLSQKIQLADAKVSSGRLHGFQNDLLVEVDSELDSLERIRQIPISVGNNSGQLARLGDFATIAKTRQEPPDELAMIDGKPGIALAVLIEPDKSIDQWMTIANQTIEEFSKNISSGINLEVIFNQNRYVETRLNNLFKNLLFGIIFVIISTTFLMGGKSALVIGSSLPLSILMVFGGMRVLGIPLHVTSLIGLIIALGMLIDNTVVMVDEIEHLLIKGWLPHKAISQAVGSLAVPLLASTLTTILSFLPIALLPGEAGEYVKTIAFNVILALSSSLLLSLTIIPAIKCRIYQKTDKHNNWWQTGFSNSLLTKSYSHVLKYILTTPILGILLSFVLPAVGFLKAGSIPEQFFPPADRDQFIIELELPLSTSLKETQSVVETASDAIWQQSEVTNLHWFFGTYAPTFYYTVPRFGIKGQIPHYAMAMVQISSDKASRPLIHTLQKSLNQVCPQARILVKQLEQSKPIPPIEVRLYGPNLDVLQELGNQVRSLLVEVPEVIHTRNSLGQVLPKLAIALDEEETQLAGLDNTQIAKQLNASLEGQIGGSIIEGTEEIPVKVRLANSDRADLDLITTLDLVSNQLRSSENTTSENTTFATLSALAELDIVPETASITRRNGQRVNTVQGFITAGILPSNVLADFQQRITNSDFQLPPNYSMEWGGESAERNQAVGNLFSTVGILIILMIVTLVLSFNSFRSAVIILLVAIGSMGLALASLWLFGYPLGFMSILGTVGLIGIAINDSIVVLAAIHNDPKGRKGDISAMIQVILRSTRHVLTTTVTTVAGFIPLFIDGGELWPPLAICIAGGVTGATLLALFFVPCVYLVITRLKLPRLR